MKELEAFFWDKVKEVNDPKEQAEVLASLILSMFNTDNKEEQDNGSNN